MANPQRQVPVAFTHCSGRFGQFAVGRDQNRTTIGGSVRTKRFQLQNSAPIHIDQSNFGINL